MQDTVPLLYCPNLRCQATNTAQAQFCQTCGMVLPKHYLWVSGTHQGAFKIGDLLADRFIFRGPQVVLDTQPGLSLKSDRDIPELVVPYLKLFHCRLHIPQPYTWLYLATEDYPNLLILLEQAPLSKTDLSDPPPAPSSGAPAEIGSGIPWAKAWPHARPLRQVHWLWQMAQLWHPFASQGVATSLLRPHLLRTEGPLVRLLELDYDPTVQPTLVDLGHLWQTWVPEAAGPLATGLEQLCEQLISGAIASSHQLQATLEDWIAHCQTSYQVKIDLATLTDTGAVREHNEDACYPDHGTVEQDVSSPLAIVCDGVGGHAGGEVASGIAIAALKNHLTKLPLTQLLADDVSNELEQATFEANDRISQQNDDEQRQDRQRMGTTLVMALVQDYQLYITHIGDSRAYLITATGCYQITVDDDIASREVRLGYVPYREALLQPASGSLVQALGMASSSVLRPTVQRLILDEDCVLLLCSDGLSDYDRVEQLWRQEIWPLLDQKTQLVTVSQRLIALANELNGHDNVTVALAHCHVTPKQDMELTELPQLQSQPQPEIATTLQRQPTAIPRSSQLRPQRPNRRLRRSLLGVLLVLGLGGVLAYLLFGLFRQQFSSRPSDPPPASPVSSPQPNLEVATRDSIVQLMRPDPVEPQDPAEPQTISLWSQEQLPPDPSAVQPQSVIDLKTVSLLLVVDDPKQIPLKKNILEGGSQLWLKVQTCQPLPSPKTTGDQTATGDPEVGNTDASDIDAGDTADSTAEAQAAVGLTPPRTGWVQASSLQPLVTKILPPDEQTGPEQNACTKLEGSAAAGSASSGTN